MNASSLRSFIRSRTWGWSIPFVLLIVVQLLLVWKPLESLVTHLLPDDAFYYFQIARNIAHGVGSTFDGIHPTNGYHPLWMVISTGVYRLLGTGPLLPIQVILTLGIAFEAAGLFFLWLVMKRASIRPLLRFTALALFALNPFVAYEFLNGLETALTFFLLSLFILTWQRCVETDSRWRDAYLGVVGGALILARTDSLLFFGAPFLFFLFQKKPWIKRAVLPIGIAFLMVLPWIIWNFATFGSILQSSGASFTVVQRQLVQLANGHLPVWYYMPKAAFSKTILGLSVLFMQTGAPFFYLFVVGLLTGMKLQKTPGSEMTAGWSATKRILAWLGATMALYFFVHVTIRWAVRSWYFIPIEMLFVLGLALWSERLLPPIRPTLRTIAIGMIIGGVIGASFLWMWWKEVQPRYGHQIEMMEAAEWSNQNIAGNDTRIGVFNAGIQGYLSHHPVVNLDGLVNNGAYHAIVARRLREYIREERVGVLLDFDRAILFKYGPAWGLPDIRTELSEGQTVTHYRLFDPGGVKLYLVR